MNKDNFLLRLPEVEQKVGLKRSSIYRLMSLGRFPKNYRISDVAVAWLKSDIDAWIEQQINHSITESPIHNNDK